MDTNFWQPGTRCRIRRLPQRTVLDITTTGERFAECCAAVQWQGCDARGLAHMPPVNVCCGCVRLTAVSAEGISEGRLILPPISDEIWPQCYLTLCMCCVSCPPEPAKDSPSTSPLPGIGEVC